MSTTIASGSLVVPNKLNVSDYTLPNGKVTQVATDGNAIVQLDKVQKFARGKVPDVTQELRSLQDFKQENRKLFDADPANALRLEDLKDLNKNYKRSIDMQKNLESVGLTNTAANNDLITQHLLEVGRKVNAENRLWVPSILEGPTGNLKVESTWKVLENEKAYLSTLKFKPVK